MIGSIVDANNNDVFLVLNDDGTWDGRLPFWGALADRQVRDLGPADGDPFSVLLDVAAKIEASHSAIRIRVVPSEETTRRLNASAETAVY